MLTKLEEGYIVQAIKEMKKIGNELKRMNDLKEIEIGLANDVSTDQIKEAIDQKKKDKGYGM